MLIVDDCLIPDKNNVLLPPYISTAGWVSEVRVGGEARVGEGTRS